MAGDRINEAYLGELGERAQQKDKGRIDWVITKSHGNTVLDIGCSQGITSLLLARRGMKVLAIDNDYESIDYAKKELEKEKNDVRENLEFVTDNFLNYELKGNKFDTIIMGEVLEHLYKPKLFMAKASKHLANDGRFIASVPFGINEHFDHKRTYYLLELFNQLNEYFCVEEICFHVRTIAYICTNKENAMKKPLEINMDVVERMENAMFDIDTELHKQIHELRDKLTLAYEKNKKDAIELKESKKVIELKENAENKIFDLNLAIEKQNIKIAEQSKEENDLKMRLVKYQKECEYQKNKVVKLEKEYQALSTSKLGKIQRTIWRKKKIGIKQRVKNWAKKYKICRDIAAWVRAKKQKGNSSPTVPQVAIPSAPNTKLNAAERRKLFEQGTDINYIKTLQERLDSIPESNGSRYYEKYDVKIGIVADEFLYQSLKDAAIFTPISPENWMNVLKNQDVLMIATAWRGLNGEWSGISNHNSKQRNLVLEIITEAKRLNINTIFYSKEDPPHYEQYVDIAKHCEYIFTTCSEVTEKYKNDCKNQNVAVVPFGINPIYHNPVGCHAVSKENGVIFSGSWMKKYPERLDSMDMLFGGVLQSEKSLKIFDRNYSYIQSENYRFPEKYWKYISPEITHETLQKVHKLYDWALNINTVTKSVSMFANRAYELQAAGNLIISNYSVGMNSKLPFVFCVNDESEIPLILNAYDKEHLYERQMMGVRSVMTGETAYDRMRLIFDTINVNYSIRKRKVLVVVNELSKNILNSYEQQSYEDKSICKICDFTEAMKQDYDIITFFTEDAEYDTFYLEDMINAFKYTNCDYITKDAYYEGDTLVEGIEHNYVEIMKNKYRTIFWSESFTVSELMELDGVVSIPNGYSNDHFNYNAQISEGEYKTSDFKLSVIVPVYNNSKHLLGKCFSSIYRSTMFNDMEIILVDDGSTDGITPKVLKYLESNYKNVKVYLFEKGGSGSASRPRNKGVEIATSKFITYLDPDNEAINDGYSRLFELINGSNYDIVFGNMLKVTTEVIDCKHIEIIEKNYGSNHIVDDSKNLIVKTNFSAPSIQAMILRRDMLIKNKLVQVEGAIGEDTLFYWEVVSNAKNIFTLNLPIHIYYAAVEGSTVNSISKKFFERQFLIENPRLELITKYNYKEEYMKIKFNYYFENWILKKLTLTSKEDEVYCTKIVYDIFEIYRLIYDRNSKLINTFVSFCEKNEFEEAIQFVKKKFV